MTSRNKRYRGGYINEEKIKMLMQTIISKSLQNATGSHLLKAMDIHIKNIRYILNRQKVVMYENEFNSPLE